MKKLELPWYTNHPVDTHYRGRVRGQGKNASFAETRFHEREFEDDIGECFQLNRMLKEVIYMSGDSCGGSCGNGGSWCDGDCDG